MMDRKEAKIRLQILLTNRCSTCRYGDKKCTQDCEFEQAVNMAIESLSAEPIDLISRAELLDRIKAVNSIPWGDDRGNAVKLVWSTEEVKRLIEKAPSADRPSGEWVEKEVMVDEDTSITEWQSAKCSVCGKYHTTPYMYYFDNFNYCPNCGAKMGGKEG